jgi:Putative prokaryotic signal transducing protein
MTDRVRIGTCSGPAEAAFVRSVFEAHDLRVVINGENHAGMLGGLGGFISLDILVAEEDAEEAVALLRDIREGDHAVADGEAPEPEADEHDDERADAQGVWRKSAEQPAGERPVPEGPFDDRRRRTGIALMLGTMAGFGTAHMFTRAWLRGTLLAGIQIAAIACAAGGAVSARDAGMGVLGARIYDMAGAIWRIYTGTAPPTGTAPRT